MVKIDRYKMQAESYYIRKKQELEREKERMGNDGLYYVPNPGDYWNPKPRPNDPMPMPNYVIGAQNHNGLIAALCLVLGMNTFAQRETFRVRALTTLNTSNANVEYIYDKLVRIAYAVKEEFPDE